MSDLAAVSGPSRIVGIGASAGGLESLQQLVSALPPTTGMGFVVVQHVSPDFRSLTDALLARPSAMPIRLAENGTPVAPNHIYLMPAGTEMIIRERRLVVTDTDPSQALSLPIDQFFRSLAQDCGPQAIAVVLSGSGSDGSRGIVDVKRHGGMVLAESISSAKLLGMPLSAQSTGVVDHAHVPRDLARILCGLPPLDESRALIDCFGGAEQFLAMLSHELRNPLAAVLSAIRLMRLAPAGDAATVQRCQEVVERQSRHMARLLDDLLDVSRVTRGKLEQRRAVTERRVAVPPTGGRCRVVLVEDQADSREMLQMLLQKRGHVVIDAADGAAAIDAIEREHPDVALVDIGLPNISGYDVARAIRRREHLDDVVLVALTGYGAPNDIAAAREAGFDEHVIKPAELAVIEELLARHKPA